jgi:hypothetical protein
MGLDIEGIVVGLEEWVGLADKGSDVGVGIGFKLMLFGDFDPTKDDIAGGKVRVVPPPMHHWGYHCHLRVYVKILNTCVISFMPRMLIRRTCNPALKFF